MKNVNLKSNIQDIIISGAICFTSAFVCTQLTSTAVGYGILTEGSRLYMMVFVLSFMIIAGIFNTIWFNSAKGLIKTAGDSITDKVLKEAEELKKGIQKRNLNK